MTARISVAMVVTALAGHLLYAQEPALESRSLIGGRVSILIPKEFTPMSEEWIQKKYPNANRPGVVYTNARMSVNVALDHTAFRVTADQLGVALDSVRTSFKTTYPSAQWFRSELRTINGRQFFLVELRTPAADVDVRNIIVGTSLDDRLLMVTFNVTKTLEPQWLAAGNAIIESIVLK